jgi:aldoxime dehydratase
MESAIPSHLRCPRTRPPRASEDYSPPFPAVTARLPASVKQVVMAYLGVQYRDAAGERTARAAIGRWKAWAAQADGPRRHDLAHYRDEAGYDTLVLIAYWDDPAPFGRWLALPELQQWWAGEDRLHEGVGWFREIVCPSADRFETIFSKADRAEGIGLLAPGMSGEIQEHGYWGSMRDRLPVSQTDALRGAAKPRLEPLAPGRVRVHGSENLALIRSGQEWGETSGQEREIYLGDVEPVLHQGMDFLRDEGLGVGCYANRYMRHLDDAFQPQERSFGMSWWQSLEQMERWSESHPTHLQIFGRFLNMVRAVNADLKLRLYHEVAVIAAADQSFEYINCHPATGLLRCAG